MTVGLRPAEDAISNVPVANTPAVVTLAAVEKQRHYLQRVIWSYSGTPTGGRLTVKDGNTVVFDIDITGGGPNRLDLDIRGSENSVMEVRLYAAGVAVVGKLNVLSYTE